MDTRSRVGIKGEDGAIVSVYCRWDGCPSGVGAELLNHYADAERAIELMKYGDLSSIEGPDFAPEGSDRGGTVAYARWRGETDVDPVTVEGREAFGKLADDCDGEYAYLYGPRGWEYAKVQLGGRCVFRPLAGTEG